MLRNSMSKIDDIKTAISTLPATELAKLRAWFAELDAQRFDERLERDAKSGKLDQLARKAIADDKAGRTRDI